MAEKEAEYLCLRLNKKVNPIQLDIDIYHFGQRNINMRDNSKNNVTWRDYAETLLRADGSWDKKPYFYKKFKVTKVEEDDEIQQKGIDETIEKTD